MNWQLRRPALSSDGGVRGPGGAVEEVVDLFGLAEAWEECPVPGNELDREAEAPAPGRSVVSPRGSPTSIVRSEHALTVLLITAPCLTLEHEIRRPLSPRSRPPHASSVEG